jgi:aminoglycoside 6'-N-acetyltransferase
VGDPREQIDLIAQELDEPLMQRWIVEHKARAFAYVQAYPTNAWPQTHLRHLPNVAVAIFAFIGEPVMLGCGHGSALLHAVGEKLLAEGVPVVAIDPDCDNHRTRRAYRRAGFFGESRVETANALLSLCFSHSLLDNGTSPRGELSQPACAAIQSM